MSKSEIIKRIIIELLRDGKMHCIKEVSLYIINFYMLQNTKISKSIISQNIGYLHKHNVIEKYDRFIKLK